MIFCVSIFYSTVNANASTPLSIFQMQLDSVGNTTSRVSDEFSDRIVADIQSPEFNSIAGALSDYCGGSCNDDDFSEKNPNVITSIVDSSYENNIIIKKGGGFQSSLKQINRLATKTNEGIEKVQDIKKLFSNISSLPRKVKKVFSSTKDLGSKISSALINDVNATKHFESYKATGDGVAFLKRLAKNENIEDILSAVYTAYETKENVEDLDKTIKSSLDLAIKYSLNEVKKQKVEEIKEIINTGNEAQIKMLLQDLIVKDLVSSEESMNENPLALRLSKEQLQTQNFYKLNKKEGIFNDTYSLEVEKNGDSLERYSNLVINKKTESRWDKIKRERKTKYYKEQEKFRDKVSKIKKLRILLNKIKILSRYGKDLSNDERSKLIKIAKDLDPNLKKYGYTYLKQVLFTKIDEWEIDYGIKNIDEEFNYKILPVEPKWKKEEGDFSDDVSTDTKQDEAEQAEETQEQNESNIQTLSGYASVMSNSWNSFVGAATEENVEITAESTLANTLGNGNVKINIHSQFGDSVVNSFDIPVSNLSKTDDNGYQYKYLGWATHSGGQLDINGNTDTIDHGSFVVGIPTSYYPDPVYPMSWTATYQGNIQGDYINTSGTIDPLAITGDITVQANFRDNNVSAVIEAKKNGVAWATARSDSVGFNNDTFHANVTVDGGGSGAIGGRCHGPTCSEMAGATSFSKNAGADQGSASAIWRANCTSNCQ